MNIQAAVGEIEDYRDGADDRELARRLVAKVTGVAGVRVRHQTIDPA